MKKIILNNKNLKKGIDYQEIDCSIHYSSSAALAAFQEDKGFEYP